MSHERGFIAECKDFMGDTYYKVYTGCNHLDDFYIANNIETALKIKSELVVSPSTITAGQVQ